MATSVVTYEAYEELALRELDQFWELHDGELVRKPGEIMTTGHNRVMDRLSWQLHRQLDPALYEVRINNARARRLSRSAYIPDVVVVPVGLVRRNIEEQPTRLEAYQEPLPLVVEVWSPSTGGYDVNSKLPEYQRRGDAEVWRIHPLQRTVTAWRRQTDGSYAELRFAGGVVELHDLAGVVIDIDLLFAP
ncbi:MAG: Uma2 family endonuclease [Dehalococcoidia bacterium]